MPFKIAVLFILVSLTNTQSVETVSNSTATSNTINLKNSTNNSKLQNNSSMPFDNFTYTEYSLQAGFGNDCFFCSGTPTSDNSRSVNCADTKWCADPNEHEGTPSFKECEITCGESTPYCYTVKTWTRDKVLQII